MRSEQKQSRRRFARLLTTAGSVVLACGMGATAMAATQTPGHAATTAHPAASPTALGATPQMGWNDWNAFGCDVNAKLVEQTADTMVADGMKAAGYTYVNIDDCWLEKQRSADGELVPDPAKFPGGIKAVADYVHSKGLKLGIYEDAGTATCAGYPGSLGHEKTDAETFASWGVDYLKYDNCNNAGSSTRQQYIDRYTAMRDALKATGRQIFYSLCEWGDNAPWTWGAQVGNSWRTTGDINDSWGSMLSIFEKNVWLYPYSGPGHWNDPDMLEVGNGGMTDTEYRSEFSLWAAMDAPLLAGTDLRTISKADLAMYTNRDVIAVDQDPLGKQAVPVANDGEPAGDNGQWVLSKQLADGDRAVVLFNSTGSAARISTTAAQVGMPRAHGYTLRDLWAHSDSETAGTIAAEVPAHGVVMYRVSAHAGAHVAPNVTYSTSAPAKDGTVTETLTDNGRTDLRGLRLSLHAPATSWSVEPTSATTFSRVRSGQTVTATFHVTAGQPSEPIETDTLTGDADYRWNGHHGSATSTSQVHTVTPVQAPYRTFSSAKDAPATFGQVGDDFAVVGGGADLWSGDDDYSTIYSSGAVGTSSTVQTEVTGQQGLSGYGKAGILVRNTMTAAGSKPEGVILFESPTGGIQLEWDDNGGSYIDQVTPANGTIPDTVPVHLKLVRSGSTYTGYYSTDGSTWTKVGSATVPDQAATQDAGMFVVSHSSGSTAQVDFHGFSVS